MSVNKVIYISIVALSKQIEEYLFIQEVIDSGFEVEYWDLKDIYLKGRPFKNAIHRPYVRGIGSFDELKSCLNREDLRRTIFVLQATFEWRVLSLYFLMTWLKCKTVHFPFMHRAAKSLAVKIWDKMRSSVLSPDFIQSLLNLFARGIKKIGLVNECGLFFVSGQLAKDAYKGRARVVDINYADYDLYLKLRGNSERVTAGDYALFLDEGCVSNPGVKIFNMPEMAPEKFYGSLNRFFNEIEKKYCLKVVIAAHPGIPYDKSVFGGREIYEGKTCKLVKDCVFVICQSSTAISFAVLYGKPAVFVYTDEYFVKRHPSFKILDYVSSSLGAKSYNMDLRESVDSLEIPQVDQARYGEYKYNILTSRESENESSGNIIVRTLKSL